MLATPDARPVGRASSAISAKPRRPTTEGIRLRGISPAPTRDERSTSSQRARRGAPSARYLGGESGSQATMGTYRPRRTRIVMGNRYPASLQGVDRGWPRGSDASARWRSAWRDVLGVVARCRCLGRNPVRRSCKVRFSGICDDSRRIPRQITWVRSDLRQAWGPPAWPRQPSWPPSSPPADPG